jgi:hypothetical protein
MTITRVLMGGSAVGVVSLLKISSPSQRPDPFTSLLAMPFVRVSSNAKRASVDIDAVLKGVSKSLSDALDRPEPFVFVDVQLDRDMCFQASTEVRQELRTT